MSQCLRFPTMWYVRPAKPQISLRIRAVWSEPLLVAWVFYDCLATDWTPFGVHKLLRRLHRLIWVYTCQNATLLEITCHGSLIMLSATVDQGTANHGVYQTLLTWTVSDCHCIDCSCSCSKFTTESIFRKMGGQVRGDCIFEKPNHVLKECVIVALAVSV